VILGYLIEAVVEGWNLSAAADKGAGAGPQRPAPKPAAPPAPPAAPPAAPEASATA